MQYRFAVQIKRHECLFGQMLLQLVNRIQAGYFFNNAEFVTIGFYRAQMNRGATVRQEINADPCRFAYPVIFIQQAHWFSAKWLV
jgi:hypothetical protein